MSSIWLSMVAVLIAGAGGSADPIDRWVVKLSADPMWENGMSPSLDLPETATTEQVIAKAFQMTGFPGKGPKYKILKIKTVHIKGSLPDLYTAVLLETGPNKEVVLLKYVGSWWSRILSVP